MDGQGFLQNLIGRHLAADAPRSESDDYETDAVELAEIRGVAVGLVAAGALSPEEMRQLMSQLRRGVGEKVSPGESPVAVHRSGLTAPGWTDVPAHHPDLARRTVTTARQSDASRAVESPPHGAPPTIERVISLTGQAARVDGTPISLVSLELWSTMLVLRLACEHPTRSSWRRDSLPRLRAWAAGDDVGTCYRLAGGAATSHHGLIMANVLFTPAPPAHAHALTLTTDPRRDDAPIVIALSRET